MQKLLSIIAGFTTLLLLFGGCKVSQKAPVDNKHSVQVEALLDTLIHYSYKRTDTEDDLIVMKSVSRQDSLVLLATFIDPEMFYLVLSNQEKDSLLGYSQYKGFDLIVFGESTTLSSFDSLNDASKSKYVKRAKKKLKSKKYDRDTSVPPFYHPLVFVHIVRNDEVIYRYTFEDYVFLE